MRPSSSFRQLTGCLVASVDNKLTRMAFIYWYVNGGGPIWEHNTLVSCWSDCHCDIGIQHKKEAKDHYINSDNRPDIVVFNAELYQPWCIACTPLVQWHRETFSKETDFTAMQQKGGKEYRKMFKRMPSRNHQTHILSLNIQTLQLLGYWWGSHQLPETPCKKINEWTRPKESQWLQGLLDVTG